MLFKRLNMMNWLQRVNAINTSRLVKEIDYNTNIKDIEDKIPNLATTTTLNAKINKVKGEIPSITGLAITTDLNDAKNNLPDVSTLVKKADCNSLDFDTSIYIRIW